jgi:glyoxylase-like metal-dependent hydrolase (beta-lactamase superfamily II)
MRTLEIGGIRVTPLDDGIGRVRPGELYAAGGHAAGGRGVAEDDWAEHAEFLDAEGRLEMPIGTFLLRVGERVALVDAGYGPVAPATVSGARLPEHLAAAGVPPEDVTDVILTHLHADHIGWCAVDGSATFPAATYRCAAADWDHFVAAADDPAAPDRRYRQVAKATLGPIEDRFEPWTGETTLLPGVDAVPAAGHTPGCSTIVLSSGGERAVLLGDVVHHPVQLLDDEWERVVDVDEDQARRTQIEVVADLIRDRVPAVGAHFPGLRFGRVVESGGRRRWVT